MTTVREVLRNKPEQQVWTITPSSTVFDAMKMMASKNVASLVVVDQNNQDNIVGIISERDYARKIILKNRSSKSTKVWEVMTQNVLFVLPDDDTGGCMALMTEKRIRHLPVLDDGKLVGIISIGDVVKEVISKQHFIIDQLSHYIHGPVSNTQGTMIGNTKKVEERVLEVQQVANFD